jgi:hypothetical protein
VATQQPVVAARGRDREAEASFPWHRFVRPVLVIEHRKGAVEDFARDALLVVEASVSRAEGQVWLGWDAAKAAPVQH